MNEPTNLSTTSSTLFTIRLWCEERGDNHSEWRGKINLHNHEVRYFRDPETLYGRIVKMVHDAQ